MSQYELFRNKSQLHTGSHFAYQILPADRFRLKLIQQWPRSVRESITSGSRFRVGRSDVGE